VVLAISVTDQERKRATGDPEPLGFYRALHPAGFGQAQERHQDETATIEADRELFDKVVTRLETPGEWIPAEEILDRLDPRG
jgi:hypothetical protein